MKYLTKILIILLSIFCLGTTGFAQKRSTPVELLQLNPNVTEVEAPFDLIFLCPTIIRLNTPDGLIDPSNPEVRETLIQFAKAQCNVIADANVRIFLPMIHQMTISGVTKAAAELRPNGVVDKEKIQTSSLQKGVKETSDAIRIYLKKYHTRGRPYILFGHSQGAIDFYLAIGITPEILPEDGFVAAYLPGLVPQTKDEILQQFSGRNIRPAAGAKDTGVILVWNSHTDKPMNSSFFASPKAYSINPANWKTNFKKCTVKTHRFIFQDSVKVFLKEYTAWNDPAAGCLKIQFDQTPLISPKFAWGDTSLHEYDVWFFADSIRKNMITRVRAYSAKTAANKK